MELLNADDLLILDLERKWFTNILRKLISKEIGTALVSFKLNSLRNIVRIVPTLDRNETLIRRIANNKLEKLHAKLRSKYD